MMDITYFLLQPLAHQQQNSTIGSDLILVSSNSSQEWQDKNNKANLTTNFDETEQNKFILPVWRQIIWSILFSGMIIVSTTGNIIVIWIVLKHKQMRTVTNYFLVNLSIADTMVSTINVIFNYVYMLNSHWPFGEVYCKVNQFIAVITICASVFTLVAISIDRYIAIVNPLKPRMGKRMTLLIASTIWIISALIALPNLLFFETYSFAKRIVCYLNWPDSDGDTSRNEYLYNVGFMILTYFLPIGSMIFTYARIGLELWGSQSIGEATQRQLENIKNKRRVVKMMMIVVVIFAVCWLPFHMYFIVTSHFPHLTNQPYIQEVYLGFYWLAMSNSMYNPIIYCWMNSRFRRGFVQAFRWLPCINLESGLSRTQAITSRSFVGSPDFRGMSVYNGTNKRRESKLNNMKVPSSTTTHGYTNGAYGWILLNDCSNHPSTLTLHDNITNDISDMI